MDKRQKTLRKFSLLEIEKSGDSKIEKSDKLREHSNKIIARNN